MATWQRARWLGGGGLVRRGGEDLRAVAAVAGQRTTGLEAAAAGHGVERGDAAGDGLEGLVVAVHARDRGEEGSCVGVGGGGEDAVHVALFDDLAGVHDGDAVGDLGDDAEVVGDEEHGHAVAGFEVGRGGRGPGPGW